MLDTILHVGVLLVAFLNLFLGFFVLYRNPKNIVHIVFFLTEISFAVWAISLFFYRYPLIFSSFAWIHVTYAMVVVYLLFLFWFSFVFPTLISSKYWFAAIASAIAYLSFSLWLLFLTRFWIVDVVIDPKKGLQTILGPGYVWWAIAGMFIYVWLAINFFTKSRHATVLQKIQLKYLISGLVIYLITVLFLDVIIPLAWKDTRYFSLSPLCNLFISGTFAYIILKHRFLDIKIALQGVVIFTITWILTATMIFIGAQMYWIASGIGTKTELFPTIIILGFVLAIISPKLVGMAKFIAGKFFFQSVYDYEKILQEVSSKLSMVVETSKLAEIVCTSLSKVLKLDQIVVLVWNAVEKKYNLSYSIGLIDERRKLLENGMLGSYFKKYPQILVFDEINNLISESTNLEFKQQIGKMYDFMDKIKIGLIMPLVESGRVEGLVILGNKISNNPYSVQDLHLLTTLSSQASVVLANTLLYRQIFDINKNLEQKVKEETLEIHGKNLALEKAFKELQSLDVMKDQLIAVTSHELKTPASIAQNYLWSVINNPEEGTKITEKDKDKLQKSLQDIQNLVKLINAILNVSKIEAGKFELTLLPVSFEKVDEIIKKVVAEFGQKSKQSGITLLYESNIDKETTVILDISRFEEIITNLVSNAFKYTKKGSIIVKVAKVNSSAEISVKDTGIGILNDDLPRIFEKFYRVDKSYTASNEETGGTGLGLYITKSLVELMKGKIWIKSEIHKGSTFYCSFSLVEK